ncbi:chemokine-like protein TAFA-5 isoform X2 [Zootoca vivipara]|nr:chemokine-like protein TAFA-5 isoform X2 [Zootoca vivipara]
MQLLKALWAIAGAAICCFLIFVIHSQFLKEGQLAAGTCEIVTLDRDSSQPRRTIARQTARCACKKGQIAGTTRARPACVDARIIKTKQWCEMLPCLEGEGCDLLINRSGWTCTQPGGRIKTTTVSLFCSLHSFAFHLNYNFSLIKPAFSHKSHTHKHTINMCVESNMLRYLSVFTSYAWPLSCALWNLSPACCMWGGL